ncbi:MAG: lysophospholipid acyltransferase family protein [Gemmatimonadaceae bacterium]
MSTFRAYIALIGGTLFWGTLVLLAQLFGVKHKPGGIFDIAPRRWSRGLLRAAGVEIVTHVNGDVSRDRSYVYIANHVSWFDIPALLETLPNFGFVAKRELEKIPLFGAAARAVGVIYIDRENRKAAFGAYDDAAKRIRDGASVVVYPEGTRGGTYSLRTFKKGPFVLAIKAGVPVVPVVVYGTMAVNPRGSLRAHPATVHVHLLEPVPTTGLTYDDRDILAERVRSRMADVMRETYHVNPATINMSDAPTSLRSAQVPA